MAHWFYDRPIFRSGQQKEIEKVVKKYRFEPVSEVLHKRIWDELQMLKALGVIYIPFKVAPRKDVIEIIIDTKV